MANETEKAKLATEGLPADTAPDGLITGEPVGTEPAPVNFDGLTPVDGVEEGTELEKDLTPAVQSLTAVHQPNGATILSARYHHPANGWTNITKVLPGLCTAKQVGDAVADVANW